MSCFIQETEVAEIYRPSIAHLMNFSNDFLRIGLGDDMYFVGLFYIALAIQLTACAGGLQAEEPQNKRPVSWYETETTAEASLYENTASREAVIKNRFSQMMGWINLSRQ